MSVIMTDHSTECGTGSHTNRCICHFVYVVQLSFHVVGTLQSMATVVLMFEAWETKYDKECAPLVKHKHFVHTALHLLNIGINGVESCLHCPTQLILAAIHKSQVHEYDCHLSHF